MVVSSGRRSRPLRRGLREPSGFYRPSTPEEGVLDPEKDGLGPVLLVEPAAA
jgi:hypothetical protein